MRAALGQLKQIRRWLFWVGLFLSWAALLLLLASFTSHSSAARPYRDQYSPSTPVLLLPPVISRHPHPGNAQNVRSELKRSSLRRRNGIYSHQRKEHAEEKCNGRRVYMYELPAAMNSWLLEQCDGKLADWLHICPHMQNEGLGAKTVEEEDWYRTDPYMLELIFHSRMRGYPCLTLDADLADAFFIPFYSGIDALRYLYGNLTRKHWQQGEELVSWLQNMHPNWRQHGGRDHFMVTGRVAWDFSRHPNASGDGWGTSLRLLPELSNVTMLFLERRPFLWTQEWEQAVPYPTAFHPSSLTSLETLRQSLLLPSSRPHLFSFSGAPRPGESGNPARRAALEQCLAASPHSCALVDCKLIRCAHDPLPIFRIQRQSEFCLQPPGDSSTRRSTFDGILAGCIPVFFSNESAYNQYTWHLPTDADSYSVFIPEADLLGGLQIESYLRHNYPPHRIQRMRHNLLELIPRVIYAKQPLPGVKDAFDVTVDGFLTKLGFHSTL